MIIRTPVGAARTFELNSYAPMSKMPSRSRRALISLVESFRHCAGLAWVQFRPDRIDKQRIAGGDIRRLHGAATAVGSAPGSR